MYEMILLYRSYMFVALKVDRIWSHFNRNRWMMS